MKQVKIKKDIFNEIMKTIKGSLAVDNSRPVLKKCKCEVDDKFIKFMSLDGYCGTILKYEHKCEDVEKFDFLFNIFTVDKDYQGINDVTIEQFDDCISFKWLDIDNNEIEKKIKIDNSEYVNFGKIIEDNRKKETTTISFHANMLIRMLKGFSKKSGDIVKLTFVNNNQINPMFIKSYDNTFGEIETIVLPVRTFEKE